MQGLRSIAAVVAGFGFMVSTVMAGTIVAGRLFLPAGVAAGAASVPGTYLAISLALSFVGAVVGGWLAARIGNAAPMAHAGALAVVTIVLAVAAARSPAPGPQPAWYAMAVGVLSAAGALAGGRLRASAAAPGGPGDGTFTGRKQ